MSPREWLLDEDRALRNALVGITVDDQRQDADGNPKAPRRVNVWFAQPDITVREQSYPYITIDLLDIREAKDRAHRGRSAPEYDRPEGIAGDSWDMDYPVPIDLIYQVTTWSRNPRHDRAILTELLTNRTPVRFGVLCPDDGTVRRMDLLDIAKPDTTDADSKRLFKNVITLSVSSELPPVSSDTYEKVLNRFVTLGITIPSTSGTP